MTATFFERPSTRVVDGDSVEWFTPTELARGPWDPDACHGGPPTALLARALERLLPSMRLVRLTVDLAKPVPMAGFRVAAEVTRAGRAVAGTRAAIVDTDDVVRATASGLHFEPLDRPAARRTSGCHRRTTGRGWPTPSPACSPSRRPSRRPPASATPSRCATHPARTSARTRPRSGCVRSRCCLTRRRRRSSGSARSPTAATPSAGTPTRRTIGFVNPDLVDRGAPGPRG